MIVSWDHYRQTPGTLLLSPSHSQHHATEARRFNSSADISYTPISAGDPIVKRSQAVAYVIGVSINSVQPSRVFNSSVVQLEQMFTLGLDDITKTIRDVVDGTEAVFVSLNPLEQVVDVLLKAPNPLTKAIQSTVNLVEAGINKVQVLL